MNVFQKGSTYTLHNTNMYEISVATLQFLQLNYELAFTEQFAIHPKCPLLLHFLQVREYTACFMRRFCLAYKSQLIKINF